MLTAGRLVSVGCGATQTEGPALLVGPGLPVGVVNVGGVDVVKVISVLDAVRVPVLWVLSWPLFVGLKRVGVPGLLGLPLGVAVVLVLFWLSSLALDVLEDVFVQEDDGPAEDRGGWV